MSDPIMPVLGRTCGQRTVEFGCPCARKEGHVGSCFCEHTLLAKPDLATSIKMLDSDEVR